MTDRAPDADAPLTIPPGGSAELAMEMHFQATPGGELEICVEVGFRNIPQLQSGPCVVQVDKATSRDIAVTILRAQGVDERLLMAILARPRSSP